jgi:thioredoxin 1/putative thioredoxin
MAMQLVNDKDFERDVLRAELPVLVDLYADWCQPCKQIEPILNQLSTELEGKVKFVRVNVDHSPMVARAFRVQSIPMLVLLQGGRPVDQLMGAVDKKAIVQMLAPVMPQAPDEVPPQELAALLKTGQVVAVDVRDASAYGRYRIPGAINVPAAEVVERKAELAPTDGRVRVLYGRGSDEAKELAAKLREGGVPAAFLVGGFLHWEAEGLEVQRG